MSYSFLRLTTLYSPVLKNHYKDFDFNTHTTYSDMLSNLMAKDYGISDVYERIFKEEFSIQSKIIIVNDFHLQSQWAREHQLSDVGVDLVIEQIRYYKPTVVEIEDLYWANEYFIDTIRTLPFVKVIFGHHCSPDNEQIVKNMKLLDFVISCSPLLANQYRNLGIKNTFLIYHAFDNLILTKVKKQTTKPSIDIVFTGSLLPGSILHESRRKLIQYLIQENINLKIYSDRIFYSKKEKIAYIAYSILEKLIGKHRSKVMLQKMHLDSDFEDQRFWNSIEPFLNKSLFGTEMYQVIQNSKICINSHGGVAGDYAANMRLFEVTGVGTCLLTDEKQNMNELFTPDIECLTYKTKEEAKEKINWLLKHPTELATIAKAGQERCLRDHTYKARAIQLNQIILKFL